jgi:hypothetical protein
VPGAIGVQTRNLTTKAKKAKKEREKNHEPHELHERKREFYTTVRVKSSQSFMDNPRNQSTTGPVREVRCPIIHFLKLDVTFASHCSLIMLDLNHEFVLPLVDAPVLPFPEVHCSGK